MVVMLCSCQQNFTPKPYAYYRIDFPEKEYRMYDSIYPFTFKYPVYGTVTPDTRYGSELYWLNIKFPKYKGTIHLTYKEIDSDFDRFIEDNWNFLFKIAQKADAIDEKIFENPDEKVYGIVYEIRGNVASQVLFYATDSVKNFLRGSLYFSTRPNHDSLAPVVAFFSKDILTMVESLKWEEKKKLNRNHHGTFN